MEQQFHEKRFPISVSDVRGVARAREERRDVDPRAGEAPRELRRWRYDVATPLGV